MCRRSRLFPPGSISLRADDARPEPPPAAAPDLPAEPAGPDRHRLRAFPGHAWKSGGQPLAYVAWQDAMRNGGRS